MEYSHINDCWSALENCKSLRDIYKLIDTFPNWAGDWNVDLDKDGIKVTNEYYDKQLDSYETEEETLYDIVAPDLVLEQNELEALDMKTGDIEVSKDIFDDFVEDTYIKIYFSDLNDDTVYTYIMKYENEDVIGMEYIGVATE